MSVNRLTQWRLLALTLSTIGIAASVAAMWPIFGDASLVVTGAASLLAGTGLALVGWWRRWSALTMIAVGVAAFLVLAPPLAAPDRMLGILPTPSAYAAVVPAVWESWRDILTLGTPVGTTDGMLVAPLILVLVGSTIASSLVLRTHRAELAGIVPAVLTVWAILWGPRDEWQPVLMAIIVMLTVAGLVTVVRQARRRRASPRTLSSFGRRVVAGITVGAAAIGCGFVGGVVPLGDRVVLRADEPPAIDVAQLSSPLSAFRGWLMPDDRGEVVMTVSGLESGDVVTLAVLDAYDGEVASVSASSFRRITATGDAPAHLGVTIQGLEGPWVPHAGIPVSVAFVGDRAPDLQSTLHLDDDTGGLIATAGLEAGDGYDVAYEPSPETPDLASLSPAGTPGLDADPPESAIARLSGWTDGASTPGERLAALVQGMLADGYVSHGIDDDEVASRAGHSLARIDALFDGIMVGDGEQYAMAAALLAEQLGFPARVVVGFAPDVTDGEPTRIVGADVAAWIEVSTQEAGWVPVQVTPEERPVPEEVETAPAPVVQPQPPLPPVQPEGGQDADPAPVPPVEPVEQQAQDDAPWIIVGWVATGIGLLLVLAAPFASVLAAKWLRRRFRRAAPDAARRVDGAWDEFVDAIVDRGGTRQGTRTRIEFARNDDEMAFARSVDATLFGADRIDDARADAAWQHGASVIAALDDGSTRRDRLLARLSPRSLRPPARG